MKAGKIILSVITLTTLFFIQSCQKGIKTEPLVEELQSKPPPPPPPPPPTGDIKTPIQVYGAWHAGNDFCTWSTIRNMTDFDTKNHWLIDRGDGRPSVNLVILSFVNPLKLLNKTNDAGTVNTTSCKSSRAVGWSAAMTWFHASTTCCRK